MNKTTLNYELGVMMFNVCNNLSLKKSEYDVYENFLGIVRAMGNVDYNDFKDGFMAESQNYAIEEEQALKLFEQNKTFMEE